MPIVIGSRSAILARVFPYSLRYLVSVKVKSQERPGERRQRVSRVAGSIIVSVAERLRDEYEIPQFPPAARGAADLRQSKIPNAISGINSTHGNVKTAIVPYQTSTQKIRVAMAIMPPPTRHTGGYANGCAGPSAAARPTKGLGT
jgi:hypothetical protein